MPSIKARIFLILLTSMLLQPLVIQAVTVHGVEPYITEYDVPTPHSGPIGITVDPDGMIWFAETNVSKISRFDPGSRAFTEYDLPLFSSRLAEEGAQVWGMAFDGEGRLWFTEATEAAIWRFDPSEESFERYPLQPRTVFPIQLAFGPEGDLWFTELYGDRIGRLDPSRVRNNTREGVSEYSIPTRDAGAAGLAFDRNGNLWFAESFSKKIAMFDTRALRFTEYELPMPVYALVDLAFDKEERLWITDHGTSKFYRFDPSTGGFKEYATSESSFFSVSLPYYIVDDSAGRIWMNEHYGNIIAAIDPGGEVLTEYVIPSGDPRFGGISNVLHLTVDQEDRIWFTEWTSNKIAVLDTRLPLPFDIEASVRMVRIERGGRAEITLRLVSDRPLRNPVRLYASGTFTTTGALEGLGISFEPSELTAERSVSTLTLKADQSLTPGVYTLMVGGRYHNVSRLVAVELAVDSPGLTPFFFEAWGLITLGLTPLLVVAVYLAFRRTVRRSSG